MPSLKRFRYALATTVPVLSFSPSLHGQAVSATLLGTVTDPSVAVVGGTKVTATEAPTG